MTIDPRRKEKGAEAFQWCKRETGGRARFELRFLRARTAVGLEQNLRRAEGLSARLQCDRSGY